MLATAKRLMATGSVCSGTATVSCGSAITATPTAITTARGNRLPVHALAASYSGGTLTDKGTPVMTKSKAEIDADQIEAMCERNEARRFKADKRAWDRMGKRLNDANALIGELNGGKFYINQRNKVGRLTGKAVIFTARQDAFDYLLRNNYV